MEYSDKKNKMNPDLPYSILNPEINSLSPSEKSKGARLVSEINEIIQFNINGNNKIKKLFKIKLLIEKFIENKIILINKIPNLIS